MGDFDFWAKEWPVISGAPHLVIGGALALIAATGLIVWRAFASEISALKAHLATKDERLLLAGDQLKNFAGKVSEGETKLLMLQEQISAKEKSEVLSATVSSTKELFQSANTIGDALGVTLGIADGVFRLSVSGVPERTIIISGAPRNSS